METGLIRTNITPAKIFVPAGLDPLIDGVRQKVTEFQAKNFTTEKKTDRDKIKSFAARVAKTKTFIDNARVEFVRDKKAGLKIIDQEGKRFRDTLDEIRDEVRLPVTKWEEAEKIRVEKERQLEIFNIDYEEALDMNDLFNREKILAAKEAEFARVEEEKRQKEEVAKQEKEQHERENRIKKEAAENATRAAEKLSADKAAKALKKEQDAKESIEKLKKERIEAEEREKNRAEEAERNRIKAEKQAERDKQAALKKAKDDFEKKAKAEKEEGEKKSAKIKADAEKKAANRKHQAAVNNVILDCFIKLDIPEKAGRKIIGAIVKGEIAGLSINY